MHYKTKSYITRHQNKKKTIQFYKHKHANKGITIDVQEIQVTVFPSLRPTIIVTKCRVHYICFILDCLHKNVVYFLLYSQMLFYPVTYAQLFLILRTLEIKHFPLIIYGFVNLTIKSFCFVQCLFHSLGHCYYNSFYEFMTSLSKFVGGILTLSTIENAALWVCFHFKCVCWYLFENPQPVYIRFTFGTNPLSQEWEVRAVVSCY